MWVSGSNDHWGNCYKKEVIHLLRGHVNALFVLDVPSERKDWADWVEGGGTADIFEILRKDAIEISQSPWQFSAEIVRGGRADTRWLIKDIIPAGTVVLMSGREGSMKSWLALDWALAVADGRPWLGRKSEAGSALYVDAEMPLDVFAQRIRGMGASAHLHVMSWQQGDEFPNSLDSPVLIQAASCHDLIVIDTLRRFMGTRKEMSSDDMAELTHMLKQLTRKGATVLVLHHAVKDLERRGYRGSTELGAGCDVVLHVERWDQDSAHKIRVSTQKTRYPQETELTLMTRKDLPAPIFEEKSAQDEREAKLIELHRLMVDHEIRRGKAPNQGEVVIFAQHLGRRQAVLNLLKAGDGTLWRSTREGVQRVYHVLSNCPSVSISNKEIGTEEDTTKKDQILSTEAGGIQMN